MKQSGRQGLALLVAAASLLAPAFAVAGDGTWTVVPTSGAGPSERSTPAAGAIGETIYVFGGVRDDFRTNIDIFYNDLYSFDTVSKAWTQLFPAGLSPAPRAFAAGLGDTDHGRFWVFGGAIYQANFVGFHAYDDLWEYDPAANEWTRLNPLVGGPGGRSRPTMWRVGDDLYIFGGINSLFQTMNDLWRFNLTTRTWTQVLPGNAPPPTRHEAQGGTSAVHGQLVVYGGEQVDLAAGGFALLDDTWAYDLASNTWSELTPTPAQPSPPRNYGAFGSIRGNLYVYGGDIPGGSQNCGAPFPQNPNDETWRFHVATGTWTKLSPQGSPPKLKRTVAAVVNRTMYLFAGFDFDCSELTSPGQIWNHDVWAFTP